MKIEIDQNDPTKFAIFLPLDHFRDFKNIDQKDEKLRKACEDIIVNILKQYKQNVKAKSLIFPDIVDSTARELIHMVAEKEGLTSISIGSKKKRIAVFHTTLFLEA